MLNFFLDFFKNDLPPRDNETYSQLNKLSDRELNDIGISRYQIEAVARGWDPKKGFSN